MTVSFIHAEERENYIVAGFTGSELDVLHAQKATDEMIRFLKQRKPLDLLLDLRNTTYIDSTGLRSLLLINRQVLDQGRQMVVVCDDEPVLQLFAISEVTSFFKLFKNINDAIEYLNTRGL